LGVSQALTADVCGVAFSQISRWEAGTATPTAVHLRRLHEYLAEIGIDEADLLAGPPPEKPKRRAKAATKEERASHG
jgi:transcriptional regulator with XRE-family HTH domain